MLISATTLLLVLITLISCASSSKREIEIPELQIEIERPTLDPIPELDVEGWSETQIQDLVEVLTTYNLNLGRLAIYSEQLEKAIDLQKEYLNEVIAILNK